MVAIIETTNTALQILSFFIVIKASNKIAMVRIAVMNGAKFAYPNGNKLKYENVSLILSVGDVAKIHTAPYGNSSKTVVRIGKIIKLIFFISIPFCIATIVLFFPHSKAGQNNGNCAACQ